MVVGGVEWQWVAVTGGGWQLMMVGDTRQMGGHDWFVVGGGWEVILAVNFIFLHLLCPMLLDSVPDLTPPPPQKKGEKVCLK